MARRGTVAAMNPSRGMVAITTEDDGFTIIELLSEWDIELGDLIAWRDDYAMGAETYRNLTKSSQSEVFVQNHAVPDAQLRQQLLLA